MSYMNCPRCGLSARQHADRVAREDCAAREHAPPGCVRH